MINLNGLIQHFESNFKKKGKDFKQGFNDTIRTVRKVKNDVSSSVSRIFEYDIKPDVVIGIAPFRNEREDPVYLVALTARTYSNLTPENFRSAEPQYAICINPLTLTDYIEKTEFSDKKEQFIKGSLAEEFSHLAIDEKYGLDKLQLEVFKNKTFKSEKVDPWYILDYIYILQGKSEACAKYVANQVAGTKIYTPKQVLKEASDIQIRPEDYFMIGGRIGDQISKTFAANILEEMKNTQDLKKVLNTINEVTKRDIDLLEFAFPEEWE